MEEDIKKILTCGAMAPSGGNSQPWQFRLTGNTVDVFALPEKDHPILNFRHRGTLLAHGGLLENILIASRAIGYDAQYAIFPDNSQPNLTVRIIFKKSIPVGDEPLYPAIQKRATNRKAYRKDPWESEKNSKLLASIPAGYEVELKLMSDKDALEKIGKAASVGELVMFEDKRLHELLVHEIVWNKQEGEKKKSGLILATMELPPPQRFALQYLLRYWPIMNILKRLGMARKIADGNAQVYASASAMGAIIVPDTDAAFFAAGRAMERVWLTATRLGLDLQLMTGMLFMHQRIVNSDHFGLSDNHIKLIEDAYRTLGAAFGTAGTIALLFRVGKGEPPSAYSPKNPPVFIS